MKSVFISPIDKHSFKLRNGQSSGGIVRKVEESTSTVVKLKPLLSYVSNLP